VPQPARIEDLLVQRHEPLQRLPLLDEPAQLPSAAPCRTRLTRAPKRLNPLADALDQHFQLIQSTVWIR
jgi:hypothetical protein